MFLFRRHWIMFSLHFVRYPTFNKFYFSPQDDDMIAWKLTPLPYQMRNTIRDYGIGNVASYWVSSWDRLRSKRFRLVSEQRNTEEGDFRFWPREKWNESQKKKKNPNPNPNPNALPALLLALFSARSFTCRSSFFGPKPHRNTCYAGYIMCKKQASNLKQMRLN